MPISDKLMKWAAKKAFNAVDLDKTGTLDTKELYICVLLIYDNINRRLPTPLAPPSLQEASADTISRNCFLSNGPVWCIQVRDDYMKKYDTNGMTPAGVQLILQPSPQICASFHVLFSQPLAHCTARCSVHVHHVVSR
jgi:hypothetical protein